jgi:two-component system, cell cycle response regulator DivK
LAKAHRPALILLDINLPGMDGFTASKKLKNFTETINIPVIDVNADTMETD